ncbi:IclR family acetate operon transcriptional repressor [Leucobacter exalbidus]|uniref:IclR family acetate operon transcriptional repressor n=1 Tax=Leucobacter exalbidus TaxID=662960 RepID=A0A940PWU7_9MICO|nr:IclR family transcriptional regulator [Leucobacter exalbidus]MBP1326799.1 IclR family acetate operon transcriptional repressor [Leucobacter exalbidus]
MPETAKPAAQSAGQKTLAVLEAALLNERFTDIVDTAQLPKSTVHRLLAFLVESEFITGDATDGYHAGRRFMTLAGRALSKLDIAALAQPIVDRLVADVDCTVHVGAVTGDEMVYLIRTDSSKPYRMRSRVGLAIPMHSTGMGKATMAYREEEFVRAYAERTGLPARTDATYTDVELLLEELARVNSRGYALDLGENEIGTVCVSAPIFNHRGEAAYGMSVSSILLEHPGTSIERLAPQAVAAANEISRLLGARI